MHSVECVPAAHWPYAGVGASFSSCTQADFPGRLLPSQHAVRQTTQGGGASFPVCSEADFPGGCFLPSMQWGRLPEGGGVSFPPTCTEADFPGGCFLPSMQWGRLPRGNSVHRGERCVLPGGCFPGRRCGIPACTEADSPLWTEWQTGVNILPWPQLRCGR